MAEKVELIVIGDSSGDFSEGSTRKGGVNAAPPCPRPDVIPVAQNQNKVPPAPNTSNDNGNQKG
jgi:hypothetical protein